MNQRYSRHIRLNEVGIEGQHKLTQAKVIVVGAGGLGCPVLLYLAGAGIGTLGIVDFDKVTLSNLQRQILYTEADLDMNKATAAKKRLQKLNSDIQINAYPITLNSNNSLEILSNYDIVVDGSDNFATRYLINDSTIKLQMPMVFGALYKYEGQVAVFNHIGGPSYRCLFPTPPTQGEVQNCSEIGILGVLPGQVGMLQATEVLKLVLGIGSVLSGKILYLNALTNEQRLLKVERNLELIKQIASQPLSQTNEADCGAIDYLTLYNLEVNKNDLWIDVRRHDESPHPQLANLVNIPLDELKTKRPSLENDSKKIIFCQSGIRARQATLLLKTYGIENCYCLEEGASEITEWLKKAP